SLRLVGNQEIRICFVNWRKIAYTHNAQRGDSERYRLWVLKKSLNGTPFHLRACAAGFLIFVRLSCGGQNRCCRATGEAHQSHDVLSYRCQEELLAHEPESPQSQAPQSDLILQFGEQGFHLLSLPLCFGELWRVDQLPRTLSDWFVLVDDKAPEGSTGALWPERARATLFGCSDVVEGSIAINSATVVEELASRTDITI